MVNDDTQVVEGEKAQIQIDFFLKIQRLQSLGYYTELEFFPFGNGVRFLVTKDGSIRQDIQGASLEYLIHKVDSYLNATTETQETPKEVVRD